MHGAASLLIAVSHSSVLIQSLYLPRNENISPKTGNFMEKTFMVTSFECPFATSSILVFSHGVYVIFYNV